MSDLVGNPKRWFSHDAAQMFILVPVTYCNDSTFSNRQAWANNADPDQTAGLSLFAISVASFGGIAPC